MSFVNPANLNQSVVRHSPSSVSFGVYTDDEVRQRSVCEITSSATYDALRNALPRGLYDPLLGPTSSSSFDGNHACVTCGQVQSLCPGHFGHIELCVPLMHPLFFPKLLTLMRMKCLGCHEFRLARRQCQVYAAKLHLIDVGRAGEALSLDEELSGAARGASESLAGERRNGGRRADGTLDAEAKREAVLASAGAIDAVLSAKLALGPAPSRRPPPSGGDDDDDDDGGGGALAVTLTLHERSARRQVLKDFQSSCAKALKCANCNAFSPKVRHDQFNKMFTCPLSARNRRSNAGENVRIRSACATLGGGGNEEDADDDGEGFDSEDEVEMEDGGGPIDDEAEEEEEEEAADPAGRNGRASQNKASSAAKSDNNESSAQKKKRQDNFMNSLEVEAQCRLTWERQSFLCSKFFGSAHSPDAGEGGGSGGGIDPSSESECDDSAYVTEEEDIGGGPPSRLPRGSRGGRVRSNSTTSNAERALGGVGRGYTIFFLRALPVPPSRFRPPVIMGNMTVEHSQNYYLSKVIELNARLRTLFNVTLELTREEEALGGGTGTDVASSSGRQLRKVREERERTQANSLRLWVELQTTVNCFMDSTRDPKGTAAAGSTPAGIRQLLEKKEGIFRKHMMGKRVNFACRSVISPDPYIGTNEIGLPLHFARTLTFPTPVTGLNVAEMRELVRRGPAEYPGAVWVEFPNGQRVDLSKMKERGRNAIAARLLSSGGSSGGMGIVKVGRQLRDGDMVLMNRQVRE